MDTTKRTDARDVAQRGTYSVAAAWEQPIGSLRNVGEIFHSDYMLSELQKVAGDRARAIADAAEVLVKFSAEQNQELLNCSARSIAYCTLALVMKGWDFFPVDRHKEFILIPQKKKNGPPSAVIVPTFYGFLRLIADQPNVISVHCDYVHENDHVEIEQGTNPKFVHRPALRNRGAIIGGYCLARLADGSAVWEYISIEDVKRHAERYVRLPEPADGKRDPKWYAAESAYDRIANKYPEQYTVIHAARMLGRRLCVSPTQIKRLREEAKRDFLSGLNREVSPQRAMDAPKPAASPEDTVSAPISDIKAVLDSVFPEDAALDSEAPDVIEGTVFEDEPEEVPEPPDDSEPVDGFRF